MPKCVFFFATKNTFEVTLKLAKSLSIKDIIAIKYSSQKASKLSRKFIGAHHLGAHAVARAETVPPLDIISKTIENPTFEGLLFEY